MVGRPRCHAGQAFGCEQRYPDEVDRIGARLARAQERAAAIRGLHGALSGLLASRGGRAVLWVAVPLVRGGQIDGVYLALLVLTPLASFEAVAPLAQAAQELSSIRAAAGRLCALVAHAPPVI